MNKKLATVLALTAVLLPACGGAEDDAESVRALHRQLQALQEQLRAPEGARSQSAAESDPLSSPFDELDLAEMQQLVQMLQTGAAPSGGMRGFGRPQAEAVGTNVYVNGQQVSQQELMMLQALYGYVRPGHYTVDAAGNVSLGGVSIGNLYGGGAAGGKGGGSNFYSNDIGGTRSYVGGDGSFSYFMDSKGRSVTVGF